MATQGVVSVLSSTGRVLMKFIAGCNGYNADKLIRALKRRSKLPTLSEAYDIAMKVGFGSKDSLVVMDKRTHEYHGGDVIGVSYRATFNRPEINPRWKQGTADYVRVVTAL